MVTPGLAQVVRRLFVLFLAVMCLLVAAVAPQASYRALLGTNVASGSTPISQTPASQGRAAPAIPRPHYRMAIAVDYEKAFLNVTQAVEFTNPGPVTLSSLVFHVAPAAFNAFTLSSATDFDVAVQPVQDGTILEIPLSQALPPGAATTVTLRWWGKLPVSNGRYGAADGVLLLTDWYPILAVLQDGVWERHQYTSIGDAFFEDVADYDVTVTAPPTVTIATGGTQVSRNDGQWVLHAENARDFAMGISSHFQTLSRKVDNVTVTVFYYGDRTEAAKASLDVAEQAMRWYGRHIGPYPFPALSIVQAPPGGEHTAQEHTGLFTLRSDIFTPAAVPIYVAHELAHAWFFASVGNDQIRQPWMDEGLVDSVSLDFFKETYPREFPAVWGTWGGSWDDFKDTLPMNRGIFDFNNGSVYFFTVYRQGAAFFAAVREAMGDQAYWKALQTYYQQYAFKIARPQDLLRTLRQAAPQADLLSIFRRFFDYPFLKYANLDLSIGGNDGQIWQGPVAVPISVSADSPTCTVSVFLDGEPITTTNHAVTITIDTASLRDGQHVIVARADDAGLNQVEVRRAFQVQQPTPTPLPTATPTATAIPAPSPTATPSLTPQATPVAPAPATAVPPETGGKVIGGLILAALVLGGIGLTLRWRARLR